MHRLELTSRGRYAVMAMVDLARAPNGQPLPLGEIATRRNISLSYLEQMFSGLRKHGLVKSHRGPGGGYKIGKPMADITVADIMKAAEDCSPAMRTRQTPRRPMQVACPSQALWTFMSDHISTMLRQISLEDVVLERSEVYKALLDAQSA